LPLAESKLKTQLDAVLRKFGFDSIKGMDKYLYGVLSEHLSGYEFDTLGDDDFKHIGGPILLNLTKN
jgi:hypothetical protein